MIFYVYGYADPTSSDPYFYIGKGYGDRYLQHFNWCNLKQQTYFYNRLRSLLLRDIIPVVTFLKSNLTEQEALNFEVEMIAKYGRIDLGTGCLCNLTEGGDGVSGLVHTEASKQKICKKRAEQFMPWMSEDQKVKISLANKQTQQTKECKQNARIKAISDRGHPVVAIDPKTDEIIHSFICLRDAIKKGFQPSAINKVLRGERDLHRGYIWRDAE